MRNSRLSIYRPAPFYDWTDIAFDNEIAVSTNYAVADIREPDKRQSAWSKTIQIPGTKAAKEVFELLHEINISLQYFNPNLKYVCAHFINDVRTFIGGIQVMDMDVMYDGTPQSVMYNCTVIGDTGDLFQAIGDKYLTDIDLSDLDHTFDLASTINTAITLGEGYGYGWKDFGIIGTPIGGTWTFEHFKPEVFEREYVRRIFLAAGKTWTSTFLDGTYYRHMAIPCVNEGNLKVSETIIENAEFYAGKTGDTTYTIAGSTIGTNWLYNASYLFAFGNPAVFDDDSSGNFFDSGGVYNTGTDIFTANYTGTYTIDSRNDFEVKIIPPAGTVTYTIIAGNFTFQVDLNYPGGTLAYPTNTVIPNTVTYTPFSILETWTGSVLSGTTFNIQLLKGNDLFLVNFKDGLGNDIVAGTSSVSIKHKATSTFQALLTQPDLQYGDTVVMNDTIPQLVKQRDFLTSIIQCEHLYVQQDPINPNNYIIERRDDFIQLINPLDWTTKLDISKPRKVIPMGDLDFKTMTYTYASDKDYLNTLYETKWNRVYGDKLQTNENDFIKGVKKTEVIFAATPVGGNPINSIVCPQLYTADIDGTNTKPMAAKIRRLYWGGPKTVPLYNFFYSGISSGLTSYNFVGMMDDPYNPTVSIDWDVPKNLYYIYPAQVYTLNNLFNRNYAKFIAEITDKDSKIVRMWVVLDENDISTFSFRKIVWIDEAYYFVNRIIDYNPNLKESTQVELLKLKIGYDPSVDQFVYGQGQGGGGMVFGNFGGGAGGNGNQNYGDNSFILGGANVYIGNG